MDVLHGQGWKGPFLVKAVMDRSQASAPGSNSRGWSQAGAGTAQQHSQFCRTVPETEAAAACPGKQCRRQLPVGGRHRGWRFPSHPGDFHKTSSQVILYHC